ncbi:MAG: ATP-binding protein [Flavobacteriales bacterium]
MGTQIQADGPWPEAQLSSEQRRNIFLVIKEATHNIVKHAGARQVAIRIHAKADQLVVEVQDDGDGLPTHAHEGMGNGLRNMARRIEALNGQFTITGSFGTTVRFTVPIPEQAVRPAPNKGSIAAITGS